MCSKIEQIGPKFTELNEIGSKQNGARILFATDDWFAEAENLLEESDPVFKPDAFTEYGKLMDGWETRRKRCEGHDWCIIRLGAPGVIRGVDVDTSFFTGNFAPRYSLQAANLIEEEEEWIPSRSTNPVGTACTDESHSKISKLHSEKWTEIIPMTPLRPGYPGTCHNYKEVDSNQIWTHLRLNMFPDGGIARLRIFGEVKPTKKVDKYQTINLIGLSNGGSCVRYSNAHYGHPKNLIRENDSESMADGWETARRLDRPPVLKADEQGILQVPGNEWAVFKLGYIGHVSSIIVDTKHFKGNYPDSVEIKGILIKPTQKLNNRILSHQDWKCILPVSKLSPNHSHEYVKEDLRNKGPFSHIKVTIAPDGGLSRLRIFGTVHTTTPI